MTDDTMKKLEQRVSELEQKLTLSKADKKPKTPRKPSEYNKFMADYMTKNKKENKPHTVLFGEAVKSWNEKKK